MPIRNFGTSSIHLDPRRVRVGAGCFSLQLAHTLFEVLHHLVDMDRVQRSEGVVEAYWFLKQGQIPSFGTHPELNLVCGYCRMVEPNSADDWVAERLETNRT